jgi:hypothetical protein
MELEGSLPHSQELSTGPYPEPDKSSPYHSILSEIDLNIIHPPILVFLVDSFVVTFPPIK